MLIFQFYVPISMSNWGFVFLGTFAFFFIVLILRNLRYRLSMKKEMCSNLETSLKLPYPVYVCDTKVYNAWYDSRHKRIVVTKPLMELFSKEELEAVLLHEVGHGQNKLFSTLSALSQYFLSSIVPALSVTYIYAILVRATEGLSINQVLLLAAVLYIIFSFIALLCIYLMWISELVADLNAVNNSLGRELSTALIKLHLLSALSNDAVVISDVFLEPNSNQEDKAVFYRISREIMITSLLAIPSGIPDFIRHLTNRLPPITHPPWNLRVGLALYAFSRDTQKS